MAPLEPLNIRTLRNLRVAVSVVVKLGSGEPHVSKEGPRRPTAGYWV